jgi:rRNA maturation endonuclease Nob1
VSVISYPDECLKLLEPPSEEKGSAEMRRYKRIPPNDFVTATFEFSPYKDCIKGEIQASVHYYDVRNKMHTVDVEPHPVKIVCDLLSPLRVGARDFDQLIASWSRTGEEQKLDGWNPRDLFNTATSSLTGKNFSVVSADSTILGGQFTGIIKCMAKGIFTNKRVGLVVYIRGPPDGKISLVKVEANSEDESQVLPVFNEVMDTFRQMPPVALVAPSGAVLTKADELLLSQERRESVGIVDETVKKRVVGYLKAEESRRVKIASVAARFSLPPQQVEDIVYEAIAEGRVEGYIDDETQEFVVAVKGAEAEKPAAVIHVGGDYVADKAVKKCRSCNRDIPLESNFCPECGSRT